MSDPGDDDMDQPVTKRELHEILRNLFAYLDGRFDSIDKRFDSIDKRFEKNVAEHAATRAFVTSELARHTTANAEQSRTELVAIDDKYKDLPDRVTKLEAAVFPAPPAKRQRRR